MTTASGKKPLELQALSESGHSAAAFAKQLKRLQTNLERAQAQKASTPHGPDRFLAFRAYKEDVRTPAFLLQGLARIFAATQDERQFSSQLARYKALEDSLGRIDAWHVFTENAEKRFKLPDAQIRILHEQRLHAIGQADAILQLHEWESGATLQALTQELVQTDWHGPRKFRRKLAQFMAKTAEKLHARIEDGVYDLRNLEGGIHEIRRKLRWLSIYAAASEGAIEVRKSGKFEKLLPRYGTESVLASKHLKLPTPENPGALENPLFIDEPLWIALSWIIQELGTIKDRGQTAEAFHHAQAMTDSGKSPAERETQLKRWLKEDWRKSTDLAKEAEAVLKPFIVEDRILLRLAKSLRSQADSDR